jgi:putative ABC transport system substrate-binding protein
MKVVRCQWSVVSVLSGSVFALCSFVEAQQQTRVPQIGYLTATRLSVIQERTDAFRQGLRERGYIEGKNIDIDWRSPEGNFERLPGLAAELVRLKVNVIVTGGGGATAPVKSATDAIPIVMTQDDDPIGSGFVASLARPGGNITGLSTLSPETTGKRLEILSEIVPKLSRVAVFGTSKSSAHALYLKETELAARTLGLKVQYFNVESKQDIATAFRAAVQSRADAVLWMVSGPLSNSNRPMISELALKSRLPVIYERRGDVIAGGLIAYGVFLPDLDRRAATYVDKILKGAKPGELPIEQPTKFELVINLKTAKQIDLQIPQRVLARADRVIR